MLKFSSDHYPCVRLYDIFKECFKNKNEVMFIWLKKAIAPTIVLSIELRSINKYLISAYYVDHINVFPIKTTKVSSK